jgi:hypothetical protein
LKSVIKLPSRKAESTSMENIFLRIAGDVVLLTLVAAAVIHGISYIKFLWAGMKAETKQKTYGK